MSSNNEYVNWIEEAISKKHIAFYNFGDFKDIKLVGNCDNVGVSYRANFKNWKQFFRLKSLTSIEDVSLKELVNELKLLRKVDFHDNIVNFFGFSEIGNPALGIRKYLLVLEYAEVSLSQYLRENFNELTWKKKVQLAYQLVKVMLYLHCEGIVHRDLHSGNVLVHQDNIKLADFGLSRKIREATSMNDPFNLVPYIEPKRLADKQYSLDEKSDVYSIGVLLWEISSGKPPLHNLYKQGDKMSSTFLVLKIFQGQRENIVPDTPSSYANVYQGCWDGEPNKRPSMIEVVKNLKEIDYFFNLVSNTVELIYNIINTGCVEKLETCVLNHFKGENVSLQVLYNWLLNNQSNSDIVFLLGYLYYNGIGAEPSYGEAFNKFSSEQDHILALYYIGLCHQYGHGVNKNEDVAFMYFKNIADRKQAMGQAKIGYLFSHLKQHQNAIGWYKVAAENGNFMAMYKLAKIFLSRKDYGSAIKFLEKAANGEYLKAINALGRCYEDGLGVTPNLEKAVDLYHKAVRLGYNKSKISLAKIFLRKRDEGEDHLAQAIFWYRKAANQDNIEAYEELKNLNKDPNVRNILQSSNEKHNIEALAILNSIL